MTRGTRLAVALATLDMMATGGEASAQDYRDTCIAAVDRGQDLRQAHKLVGARAQFLECSRDECPAPVRKDCVASLGEVEASLPSVVLGARDRNAADLVEVRAFVDGELLQPRLDGKAVAVDPGWHVFRFEAASLGKREVGVLVRQGEKNRVVAADFSDDTRGRSRAPASGATRRIPIASIVAGGLGVVSLASFGYFGLTGNAELRDLRSGCSPRCAQSDVDAAMTKLGVADVSLVVGVVAIGVATWIYFAARSTSAESSP